MKGKLFLILLAAVAAGAGCRARDEGRAPRTGETLQATASHRQPPKRAAAQPADDGHGHGQQAAEVPAFQTDAAELKSLKPTLSPAGFTGKQKEGYAAAQAIPKTLAQLPCYCHCDKGFGHKSLHTCFVDDHAAHCAVCIDEALLAYKLEKEEKLKPEQIRERIVAKYTAEQANHAGHNH